MSLYLAAKETDFLFIFLNLVFSGSSTGFLNPFKRFSFDFDCSAFSPMFSHNQQLSKSSILKDIFGQLLAVCHKSTLYFLSPI